MSLRVLVTVAFAALMVSGCLDGGAQSSKAAAIKGHGNAVKPGAMGLAPRDLPDQLVSPEVLPAIQLGASAGEPNIVAAPDGTIYVTPITNLYRSTDGGKSFRDLGTTKTAGHGDGDIAVTADGRLHWLGLGGESTSAHPKGPIPYQYSDDKGEHFTEPRDISQRMGSDREWIDARPEGTIYASWRGSVMQDGKKVGAIATNVSFDDGETWSGSLGTLYTPSDIGGNIIHGPTVGSVYEAITTLASPPGPVPVATSGSRILLAVSHNHGMNWTTKQIFAPTQSVQYSIVGLSTSIFPVTAVDQAGTIYVVFAADQQDVLPLRAQPLPKPMTRFGVFLMVSHDEGDHWTPPRLLSTAGKAAVMPWVVAGAPGRIAVSFYENTLGTPNDNLPDLWNVKLVEGIHVDGDSPQLVTTQLNGQMPSHIGSICTAGTGCIAGGDRSLLDYFECALTPDGQPIVAWASSNGGTVFGGIPSTNIFFGTVKGTPLQ